MFKTKGLMRYFFIIILFLLSSCGHSGNGYIDYIMCNNDNNSAKIVYHNTDNISFDLELLRINDNIYSYVNLHNKILSQDSIDDNLSLEIDSQIYNNIGIICNGGQKLSFNNDITNNIIQALMNNQQIAIIIDGYKNNIKATNFKGDFDKFINKNHYLKEIIETFL
jgi:hypothetical protein